MMQSNFDFLSKYWEELAELGKTAESYLYSDPNTAIYKVGMLSERIVAEIFAIEKITIPEYSTQSERINILRHTIQLPHNIDDLLFAIRKSRNDAVHDGKSTLDKARVLLRMAYNLSVWFMQVYGDWDFEPKDYQDPEDCTNQDNFADLLRKQEEKLKELEEQVSQIATTQATTAPKEERIKQSSTASENLEITTSEEEYLQEEPVHMDISLIPVVNYALQQNGLPVILSITIVNNTPEELADLDIIITSNPSIALPFHTKVTYVPPNTIFEIKNPDLHLDASFLASLTEKIKGTLHVSLEKESEVLSSEDLEITALAFDEWQGSTIYPEILASFVTPNHPSIAKINARAAEYLRDWTGDPSLDAYQTQNPDRVKKQAAAVYAALQEQNIVYAVPPASFEQIGRRIRLCDTLFEQKMGCCIDLTLCYASCLEAIGLHPILIVLPTHVFTGIWLDDLTFRESVHDDVALLTKRMAAGIHEILAVETTGVCSGRQSDFDTACQTAEHELNGENPIECIIDVRRARISRISPLPISVLTENGWEIQDNPADGTVHAEDPAYVGDRVTVNDTDTTEPRDKLQIWENKLLDLGLRNALINMRLSRTMVPLITPSIDELDDALAQGKKFIIAPLPLDWHIPKTQLGFENVHDLGNSKDVIATEFRLKRLRSIYTEEELDKRLKTLFRNAKLSIEENGANTLYLALGLLRWYETKKSQKPRYAPIVLLPVELTRKFSSNGYVLSLRDDDAQLNITLLEKLKQEFHITINGLDPLPLDEYGLDIRKIFTIVRKSIMNQGRWDVLESAYLGIFSFSQFVMWNDLHNRSESIVSNKIVKSLIDGKLSWHAKEMNASDKVSEDDVYLPIPADASQLYAIEAANDSISFVLHGPPGTGKSQTITSLIANTLAQGKTVLFVAEKMAALEVVQKRLEKIGIAPFCLELHSNKAKKKDILKQLQSVTELTKHRSPQEYAAKAQEIATIRGELNVYASALHHPLHCGETLFSIINAYETYSSYPDVCQFSRTYISTIKPGDLSTLTTLVERLVAAGKEIGTPHNHPLSAIKCTQYSQSFKTEIPELVAAYTEALVSLSSALNVYVTLLECAEEKRDFNTLENIAEEAKTLLNLFDNYSLFLYAERPCGKTVFELLSEIAAQANLPKLYAFSDKFAEDANTYDLVKKQEFFNSIIKTAKNIGHPTNHPLSFIHQNTGFPGIESTAEQLVEKYAESLNSLANAVSEFNSRIHERFTGSRKQIEHLVAVAEALKPLTRYPDAWFEAVETKKHLNGVVALAKKYLELEESHLALGKTWTDGFFRADGRALETAYAEALAKGFFARGGALKALLKQLQTYSRVKLDRNYLPTYINNLIKYQDLKGTAEKLFREYGDGLEDPSLFEDIDWNGIITSAESALDAYANISTYCNAETLKENASNMQGLYTAGKELTKVWNEVTEIGENLSGLLQIEETQDQNWIESQLDICSKLEKYQDGIQAWIAWNELAAKAEKSGFQPVIDAYGEGHAHDDIEACYQTAVNDSLVESYILGDFALRMNRITSRAELEQLAAAIRVFEKSESSKDLRTVASELVNAWALAKKTSGNLSSLLAIDPDITNANWILSQQYLCSQISEHINSLKEWITWNAIAAEAENRGLKTVVTAYCNGANSKDIAGSFKKAMYNALAIGAIDANPVLANFSGAQFNEIIAQFRKIDAEFTELTKKEIYHLLAARLPNFSSIAARSSELNILLRAIRSNGRGMSIRRLFEQIPNLLPLLCPCMLMSPISAAQYLDPDCDLFDLVVFDEASQLPTWKSVGAIARGKEAIIVGDPKQMPPTSFFMTNIEDEDNMETEDLESILQDCLALNMPQSHLLWHYRSRHESLIAFSNSRFYENKLYTFPSINERESRVRLIHVDGEFDRANSRTNYEEAKAIVDEIIARCHDPARSKQSVGVVTFNISQQSLIDDLLANACITDPELEEWAFQSKEPIFIKNLENVQGDERDVILFSIGYGPDKTGKVSMNFGPLNREGGWRRLNVAVSRAREEMLIYAALRPEQIDLTRTSAEGVAALKAFLEYAEGIPLPCDAATCEYQQTHTGGIAKSIAEILGDNGYNTDISIGNSKFRVDIGVVDPENPGKYLMGILLDGDVYGDAKTAHDREIGQIDVLKGLGWHILRIWSLDWWDNKEKEVERILTMLENIKKGTYEEPKASGPAAKTVSQPPKAEPVKPVSKAPTDEKTKSKEKIRVPPDEEVKPTAKKTEKGGLHPVRKIEYSQVSLGYTLFSLESYCYNPRMDKEIKAKIETVLNSEGPISQPLLIRKVMQSCGIARTGNIILDYMQRTLNDMKVFSTDKAGKPLPITSPETVFLWSKSCTPESYSDVRTPWHSLEKRDAGDVTVIEAANAICYILQESLSASETDLMKEGAKLLGYTRMGPAVSALMTEAFDYASRHGWIKKGRNEAWILG